MSYKQTRRLNNHISRFADTFYVAGNSFSYIDLRRKMRRYFPSISRANPSTLAGYRQFGALQTRLNKLLEQRGMYLASKNGYTEFAILDRTQIPAKIQHHARKSELAATHAANLSANFRTHASVWTPLDVEEMREISSHIGATYVRPTYRI